MSAFFLRLNVGLPCRDSARPTCNLSVKKIDLLTRLPPFPDILPLHGLSLPDTELGLAMLSDG